MLVMAGAAGELGPLFKGVDEVLTWTSGGLNLELIHRVRQLHPEVVLDYTGTDRSAFLSGISGAAVRVAYSKFAHGLLRSLVPTVTCEASVRNLHTLDFHAALPRPAGLILPHFPEAGHLQLPPNLDLPHPGAPCIAVHPGTARADKFWPEEEWAALLDHLHARYSRPLVLTGGPADFEQEHIRKILSRTKAPVLNYAGALNLPQLAGILAGARLAITVDTAAMHLASSWQVPQVALFGPTNPFHWAPRHEQAIVLQSGVPAGQPLQPRQSGAPMDGLSWQTVAAAAARLLDPDSP